MRYCDTSLQCSISRDTFSERLAPPKMVLVDVSDIFYFFLLGGGERGARGAKIGFLRKIPGGGRVPTRGGEGPGGWLRGAWGGGAKYFFSGPKCPPRKFSELCVLLFFLGKSTKSSQNPGLGSEFLATPRGQRNRTGPIANSSD